MPSKAEIRRAGALRRARRIIGENGKWYAPDCPPDKHGRASGATYWFCHCDLCEGYVRRSAGRKSDRKKHNADIISTLERDATVPDGVVAPGRHLSDEADQGFPSLPPGSAPATRHVAEDNVGPTQVSDPGPTNPDEYRADLLRTFALAGMYEPPQDS